jgi:flavin reductase (DIM6/NTAB) family NADH-FMN oxidoreductase RutF
MVSAGDTPDSFKAAMRAYASGVTLITVHAADQSPIGMTATAFSSVSMDPLLVLICVHEETRTYDRLLRSGYFGVNILSAHAEEISTYCSRPGGTKVLPREWLVDAPQWTAPAVTGALAFLDCEIYRHFPAGSHRVVVGRVRGIGLAEGSPGDNPLVHYQGAYHTLHRTTSQETLRMPLPSDIAPQDPARPALATNGSAS